MISRFKQLILASTMILPLLLSIGLVVVIKYPSGYFCGWTDWCEQGDIPNNYLWWLPTLCCIIIIVITIWTICILNGLRKSRRGARSIILSSLQYRQPDILYQFLSLVPSWLPLFFDKNTEYVLIITTIISLILVFYISEQGYVSCVFYILGYKVYEGRNRNETTMLLLSRRVWNNPADVCNIIPLADNLSLII